MNYVNPNIKNTVRVFPLQGRADYYRYDMNENPEGLPKNFVASVLQEITPEFLSIYPEPDAFLNKYAGFIGARSENVLATNGSDMAIGYILETFGEPGKLQHQTTGGTESDNDYRIDRTGKSGRTICG